MNPEESYYPKNGWFFKNEKFPGFRGFSFSLGLAKEPTDHCMNGYDNLITHKGYETYVFLYLFDRQLQIGYKSVKRVR
jgi:hypothetical protein